MVWKLIIQPKKKSIINDGENLKEMADTVDDIEEDLHEARAYRHS